MGVPALPHAAGRSPIPASAGVGLRFPHHAQAANGTAAAAWFEVHAENYMTDGAARVELHAVARRAPLSLHAVGLSLGSAEGVDRIHLHRLTELVQEFTPGLVSDHLSWCRNGDVYLPDLLPLPYADEALDTVCRNVDVVQRTLGRTLLIENPSTYLQYAGESMTEPQFLRALVARTGCGVLLDVNNVFVSACNRGLDAVVVLDEYLALLDARYIGELHLAGHATVCADDGRELRIDDHGSEVCAEVWALYQRCLGALGPRPTLIEWDSHLPEFAVLAAQAAQAQRHLDAAAGACAPARWSTGESSRVAAR